MQRTDNLGMTAIKRFEDIDAWQSGRVLVSSIYRACSDGAFSRDFALRDQIRNAVISIPSNIAEGFERFRPREFHRFLSIAKGSCAEVRTQLIWRRISDTSGNRYSVSF